MPRNYLSARTPARSAWRCPLLGCPLFGCAALLLLAHFGKEGRPQPILLDVSQETLAEMIGTTRSRVSYFMNKFRKLGLISYNGKIEVHNSLLNAVLREKPEIKREDPSSQG